MKKQQSTYSLLAEMMASPVNPMPQFYQDSQLLTMRMGLQRMENHDTPMPNDWRCVSDAVNLMETIVEMGIAEDTQCLLADAVKAMGEAGERAMEGKPLRLSGPGIQAVRAVLNDYSEMLSVLPARTMIRAHRLTEKRIRDILAGKGREHDVRVVTI